MFLHLLQKLEFLYPDPTAKANDPKYVCVCACVRVYVSASACVCMCLHVLACALIIFNIRRGACYLVPALLPPDTLDLSLLWPKSTARMELGRQYKLDFIPSGFFSRLMIRMFFFIHLSCVLLLSFLCGWYNAWEKYHLLLLLLICFDIST